MIEYTGPRAFITSAADLETVPDGTVISWLRIPGDHTSEAVAFVRREVENMGEGVRGLRHVTWISPGGWQPMSVADAGVTFPCQVIRWGEVPASAPEPPLPTGDLFADIGMDAPQLPVYAVPGMNGGTWSRQAALDAAARSWSGVGAGVAKAERVIDTAEKLLEWLDGKDAVYEQGYRDGSDSTAMDYQLAADEAVEQGDDLEQAPDLGTLTAIMRRWEQSGVPREALEKAARQVWAANQ